MAVHETLFKSEIIDLLLNKNYPNWTIVEDKRSGIEVDSFIIFKKDDLFIKVCVQKNEFDEEESTKTLGIAIERHNSSSQPNLKDLFKYSHLRNSFNIPINTSSNLSNEEILQKLPEKNYTAEPLPFLLLQENHLFKDFFKSDTDLEAIFSTYLENTPKRYRRFLTQAPFTLDYIHDKLIYHCINEDNAIHYNDGDNCIYCITDKNHDYFVVKNQSGGYLIEKIKEGEFIGFYFGEGSLYSNPHELLKADLTPQLMSFKIQEHKLIQYDSLIGYISFSMAGAVLELNKLEPKQSQSENADEEIPLFAFDLFNTYSIVQEYQKIRIIEHEKKLLFNLIETNDKSAPGFKI